MKSSFPTPTILCNRLYCALAFVKVLKICYIYSEILFAIRAGQVPKYTNEEAPGLGAGFIITREPDRGL
jgi:hypothetical protein